jgi:hypothetical protein
MSLKKMKNYTYWSFGYPVELEDVELAEDAGYWVAVVDREEVLKSEGQRIWNIMRDIGKWPSTEEFAVMKEAVEKGYIEK